MKAHEQSSAGVRTARQGQAENTHGKAPQGIAEATGQRPQITLGKITQGAFGPERTVSLSGSIVCDARDAREVVRDLRDTISLYHENKY